MIILYLFIQNASNNNTTSVREVRYVVANLHYFMRYKYTNKKYSLD